MTAITETPVAAGSTGSVHRYTRCMDDDPKQVIVLRKDLGMRKGKMIAQGAHASMRAILAHATASHDADGNPQLVVQGPRAMHEWLSNRFKKIAVGVQSEEELVEIHAKAVAAGLPCALIRDSGKTEFGGVPTLTAAAVGPAAPREVDAITGHLGLL